MRILLSFTHTILTCTSNFEDKLVLLDSFYENNTENDLSEQIDLFDKLQEEKINLIKKSEISLLNFFKNHNEFIDDIHLSFLRNIVLRNRKFDSSQKFDHKVR